jgi:hypothetical protein
MVAVLHHLKWFVLFGLRVWIKTKVGADMVVCDKCVTNPQTLIDNGFKNYALVVIFILKVTFPYCQTILLSIVHVINLCEHP